jgi:hypothetical protein
MNDTNDLADRTLVGFAEYALERYPWAIPLDRRPTLARAEQDAKKAIQSSNPQLIAQRGEELLREIQDLPDVNFLFCLWSMLWLLSDRIRSLISHSCETDVAKQLMEALHRLETAVRNADSVAHVGWSCGDAQRVEGIVAYLESQQCKHCGTLRVHGRCPRGCEDTCLEDLPLLERLQLLRLPRDGTSHGRESLTTPVPQHEEGQVMSKPGIDLGNVGNVFDCQEPRILKPKQGQGMGKCIGIDLGDTWSAMAVVDGQEPTILKTKEGEERMRSAVGVRCSKNPQDIEPEILVGDLAYDNLASAPADTIHSIRRLVGHSVDDPEVERLRRSVSYNIVSASEAAIDSLRVVMHGKEYSPVDITAMILRKLRQDAELRLGRHVNDAVVTIPPYFTLVRRRKTIDAVLQAGFKSVKLLDEPTAAALAFTAEHEDRTEPTTILLCEPARDALHVSLVVCEAGGGVPRVTLKDYDSDWELGTEAILHALIDQAMELLARYSHENGIVPGIDTHRDRDAALLFLNAHERAVKAAQRHLTWDDVADLIVTALPSASCEGLEAARQIDPQEYARTFQPLIDKAVHRATVLIERVLARRDGMAIEQVDQVLVIGEFSEFPLIQSTLANLFGPGNSVKIACAKQAVALGAAIFAACLACGHDECGTIALPDRFIDRLDEHDD